MQTNTDPEYERLDQLVYAYERRDQDKKTEDETEHSDNIAFGNLQPMHTLQHVHTNTEPEYERLDQLVHTRQDKKMEDKLDCSESIGFGNLQSMRILQPIHTNTNPEYERLDQLVCTYETEQDEKMDDKTEYSGASTNYVPSD